MKEQTAPVAIPGEWVLLLSGEQRRAARLSVDLGVAGRLALRRTPRIRAGRWHGHGGACVGERGEAQSGATHDACGSDRGGNEADEATRHSFVHVEFSLVSG